MKRKARWALAGVLALAAPVLLAACGTPPPLDVSARVLQGAAPDTACGQSLCSILRLGEPIDFIAGERVHPARWQEYPVDAMWRSPSGQMWAVGFSGLGLVHWDGRRWLHYPRMGGFKSVWGSGDDDVWAVGDNVVHWDGARWERRSAGLERSYGLLWAVWGSGRGDVWASGEFGRVVHWSGTRWEERPIGVERDVVAISGSSADHVWVGSFDREIARWDGRSWHAQRPPAFTSVLPSMEALAVVAPDEVWLADGRDLFRWDGRRWTHVPTDFNADHVVAAHGRILAAGTVGQQFVTGDGSNVGAWEWRENRWTRLGIRTKGGIAALVPDDRGRIWIGTDAGEVMRLDP